MRLTISLSLLAATAGLAACGSSSPSATTGAASNAAAGKQAAGLRFAQCIRSHGVPNFPDPTANGHGGIQIQQSERSGSGASTRVNGVSVNGPAFHDAMQACRGYLPNGGRPTAAQSAKARAQALAMSRCMRSHGVPNFPDPQFQTGPNGGVGIRLSGAGVNPSSPSFQAAQKACASTGGFKLAP